MRRTFSHKSLFALSQELTAATFSKWHIHWVHSPSPENFSGSTSGLAGGGGSVMICVAEDL